MNRFLTKWALGLLLGVSVWAGSTPEAKAQFMPGGFRPGFYYSGPFGNYAFNQSYSQAFRYSFVNPYNGLTYSYGYSSFQTGWSPYGGYTPAYVPYPNYNYNYNYNSGGAYNSGSAGNPVIQQQLRLFAGAHNPVNAGGAADPKANQPAWAAPKAKQAANPNAAPLDPALLTARDADVLSGKALNEIALVIRGLEAKGVKADSSLLPPELLTKLAYQGGPAAEVMTTASVGAVSFPWPLTRTDFAQIRTDLEPPANAVLDPLAAGKKVDAATADKLTVAVTKAKTAITPQLRGIPADDVANVNRFLDRLTAVAKAAKDPALSGAVVPKWGTVGATVGEVLKHLERFRVIYAPAPTGSEEAYFALYRGLVEYYAALAQGKS